MSERSTSSLEKAEVATESPPKPLHPTTKKRSTVAAYIALTKPRIIELLLTTTIPTVILAAGGWPSWQVLVSCIVFGYLAAGSANAYNMVLDRDIDAVMNRTKQRPLVTGEISARAATIFATALGIISIIGFGVFTNWLAGALAAIAILLYVVLYTIILKRRTDQNIIWGGAAGCMPVLIAWAAQTGTLDWAAAVLFLIIFFWTPPHYWPLSMKFAKDYRKAGVPMLGAIADDATVSRRVVLYGALTVAATLALIPIAPMGLLYSVAAVAAGAWFLWSCIDLYRHARHPERGRPKAMKVFHGSIYYLTIIFLAIAIDPFLV
ncbi:heme o synthase [Flaviflexus huanghaiensis]|uniref:heme o synthase n=1 Tax=Flaviflexus huanghaiensis TaxID=1111473 RepID=UPI0019D59B7E